MKSKCNQHVCGENNLLDHCVEILTSIFNFVYHVKLRELLNEIFC